MRFLLLLLPLAWLASCQSESKPAAPVAVHDGLGRALTLPAHPRRVLALAPSMTEMLYAVADTATIVARCPQDNFPAAVLRKPVVNNYPLDLERLVTLKPEVVFTVEGITSVDDAKRLQDLGIPVYYMRFRKVEDVFAGMEKLGRLLGRPAQGHRVADSLRQSLNTLVNSPTHQSANPPKVLAITWQDPIYCYGQNTLFTDEISLASGQNAVTETFPQPYPALTREYILKLNPDVLLGGSFEKLDRTFFKNYPELKRINAYKTHRVFAITGNLMERPGPRVVESVRELQGLLQQPASTASTAVH
ncbi:ABC transporter substrate-binding protein [Hymenobacter properus]|uniref:ABC transporter substrate-binding protein n=1 Tax=Hymenobacter properus TaxID=2791026 RepID=A0A931BH93_9BACT|nr:helical backbone metal receptor [Hymenobacter properus]MBF9142343.1 ABC transporter substrate-binding protein [Hymenobacter properus]MBR7721150.1 ABC transporter substrate-binding protein [Microvirga sp. SRT04]